MTHARHKDLPPVLRDKISIPIGTGCWIWTAGKTVQGYGRLWVGGTYRPAHRLAFVALRGEIAGGLPLDHLCRCHPCVNPDHLEAVTHRVNILRGIGPTAINAQKTHCPAGHPFSGDNLSKYTGQRVCLACHAVQSKDFRRRHREAAGKAILVGNTDKTHCNRGHELSGENLIRRHDGHRGCRSCARETSRRYEARKRRRRTDA